MPVKIPAYILKMMVDGVPNKMMTMTKKHGVRLHFDEIKIEPNGNVTFMKDGQQCFSFPIEGYAPGQDIHLLGIKGTCKAIIQS